MDNTWGDKSQAVAVFKMMEDQAQEQQARHQSLLDSIAVDRVRREQLATQLEAECDLWLQRSCSAQAETAGLTSIVRTLGELSRYLRQSIS